MLVNDIRNNFINFFEERDHLRIPSSSLVPHNDPSLMFTTAGMVQFKPYFMGVDKPPANRLTSIQKCFRTTDIELVGDLNHLTFFEMLGNFSVGDYYKDDAIKWAWDFLVNELSIDKSKLWATVYKDDDEAFDLWKKIGIPEKKILRYTSEQGNWWGPPGTSGPCGPCSELHYDFGEPNKVTKNYQPNNDHPALDSGRFLEIWNLVFMSFFQNEDGSRKPLPATNIDTGAGLERLASVVTGVKSVYETDELSKLLPVTFDAVQYSQQSVKDEDFFWIRSISEHARALSFLISDGVHPSNDGRGYILRRLLRRAVYGGYKLGKKTPFLSSIVKESIQLSQSYYPEIKDQEQLILNLIGNEESRFQDTLSKGINLLEEQISTIGSHKELSGEIAFKLYDTHGLPYELVKEISRQNNITVNEEEYNKYMIKQQARSRSSITVSNNNDNQLSEQISNMEPTEFIGYELVSNDALALNVFEEDRDGMIVTNVILNQTAMYPEGGGQVADKGAITSKNGTFEVEDVQSFGGVIVHTGQFANGSFKNGDKVKVTVNNSLRLSAAANHTATHLLFAALKNLLGSHVKQAGSYVGPDRLRFDYTTTSTPSIDLLNNIQSMVNAKIRENIHSHVEEMDYDAALQTGASAFFGDKYSSVVRVVEFCESRGSSQADDNSCFSKELCGGTHLTSTGQAGLFIILSDSSIGSGIRRIEAITGEIADNFLTQQLNLINTLGDKLKIPSNEIINRVDNLEKQIKDANTLVEELEAKVQKSNASQYIDQAIEYKDIKIIKEFIQATNPESLKILIDEIRKNSSKTIVLLSSIYNDKAQLLIGVSGDLIDRGLHAGNLVKEGSKILGGGGGGKSTFAQGGGDNIKHAEEVLNMLSEQIKNII
ncbi:MAG: alanine--tRNA ligase [Dehalococcoidia bacterium]|nr:alanine--tRNA ligase [Dehalococcoidia bacterium]